MREWQGACTRGTWGDDEITSFHAGFIEINRPESP
jgi:hypothetical protein